MPRTSDEADGRCVELLEKLVLLQLHALGATQEKIARFLRKQTAWVNACLKDVPKPKKEK
jgi:hypothetical protein